MLEFQEFKVFWEKMKKWIVRVDLCSKKVANKLYCNQPPGGDFRDLSLFYRVEFIVRISQNTRRIEG